MHRIMSQKVGGPPFDGLTRYNSAPGSFLTNVSGPQEDISHLHHSSNHALLSSLFSEEHFAAAWTQHNGAGPVHMFHQFPILDEPNSFMPKQLEDHPSRPNLEIEKAKPGKLSDGLTSRSKQAAAPPYQSAVLGYPHLVCSNEFVCDQGSKTRWDPQENRTGQPISIFSQHGMPPSSESLKRTSNLHQSSTLERYLNHFGCEIQSSEGGEDKSRIPTNGRTSQIVSKSTGKSEFEVPLDKVDSLRNKSNGCEEMDNGKCSPFDTVSGTSSSPRKRFRSHGTDSSSSEMLLDGGPQEQTCISVTTQEPLSSNLTPCQSRAKRGHATHPRSIAERVRRTRISERIKRLQELVPDMDKQINTAEMLDEVVEYVQFLQKQVQELSKDHPSKVECD
ncbi:hypothetical protein O6H91_19G085200 [Diphasiastrum complanatum]|uniref:Uncharacterized protein n=1 Tax=Diphasiastrum complanatum TaxID=34168 RepID=A0ACC2AXA2_DIPCM|nr:hypothetical protein O6H91_19G085200 [Diphasiastrum complanatum]